jgi:hypothetical protein
MTAGCIPIASPVGAFPEIVQNDKNGFLMEGDPNDPDTWSRTADLICELQANPSRLESLNKNAQKWPLDWQEVVRTWEQHWDILLGNTPSETFTTSHICQECKSNMTRFADGLHCLSCGAFFKNVEETR